VFDVLLSVYLCECASGSYLYHFNMCVQASILVVCVASLHVLQVEQLSSVMKHHIPAAVLFRDHWAGLLLQFLLEASFGTLFYTFFTWVPSHLSEVLGVPSSNTLWALLIGLLLFATACPLAGHYICDKKVSSSGCWQAAVWVVRFQVVRLLLLQGPGLATNLKVRAWLQNNKKTRSKLLRWLVQPVSGPH
jgi:hypothetical protein